MLHRALAVLALVSATTAHAQRVPGRDLLTYPLGLTGEPGALGTGPAAGLWNPATARLDDSARARLGVAALNAPVELGLQGQLVHVSIDVPRIGTAALSFAHAGVTGLVRTETDPQSIGSDIPYGTTLASLGVARRVHQSAIVGLATRWRGGRVDRNRGNSFAADAGAVFDHLPFDGRIGVSTFLWTPRGNDAPVLSAAADARVAGADSLRRVRAGAAYSHMRGGATEQYVFLDARFDKVIVRGGPVRLEAFGDARWRMRLGLVVQHGGYTVALAREDNASGLGPTYQLALSTVFAR